jgi:hypothetical protein
MFSAVSKPPRRRGGDVLAELPLILLLLIIFQDLLDLVV